MNTNQQNVRTRWVILTLAFIAAGPPPASASRLDQLLADLAGDDDVVQAQARHLLPRESIEAVPKLLAAVVQEKERVWRPAFNVLEDFCNQVSVPGREAERLTVAGQVMTLVAPEQSAVIKMRGLRLLPLVVPAGYDLAPIAKLLDDAELRERARVALAEMRTPESLAALRNALPKADAVFQCALLDTLAITRDAGSIDAVKPLLAASDERVRIAALRALSWTGNPALLDTAEKLFAAAAAENQAQTRDALLRLNFAIENQGGNWQPLVEANLRWIKGGDQQLKQAALACLGRVGDGSCVAPVLEAIKGADNPTWAIGVQALGTMRGEDTAAALVAAYGSQDAGMQMALLPVLGGKKSVLTIPTLSEAAKSTNASARVAALHAIADSELPESLPILVNAARGGTDEEKAVAHAGLLRIATGLRAAGKNKEAGQAYLAALDTAAADDGRRAALQGLTLCPVSEAANAVALLADNKELKADVLTALIAVAGTLVAEGKRDDALKAYQKARELGGDAEAMKLVAKGMKDLGANVDLSSLLGIVTNWWVVGPFDLDPENAGWNKEYISEPKADLNARYMAGKRRLDWKQVTSGDDRGLVNLLQVLGPAEHTVGYAYTEVEIPQETQAVLNVGADDSERIWVNGEKVFELFSPRGLAPDQDKVPVKLKAGKNTILMKIWQQSAGWEFCLRITTTDGQPVSFINKPGK